MTKIALDTIVTVAAEQVACDLDGETAVMNLAQGTYHGLDPVATTIWQLIAEPRRVSALADLIMERYAVERDECERDLLAFLTQLNERGLLQVIASDGA